MTKEGYQPIKNTIKKTTKIIPPNTGSHVQMKKEGYTWEDLDKAFWEGFDSAKSKMQKRIAELEKENAELNEKLEHRNCVDCSNHGSNIKLYKAKEIILNILNNFAYPIGREDWTEEDVEIVIKAEQFINEKFDYLKKDFINKSVDTNNEKC